MAKMTWLENRGYKSVCLLQVLNTYKQTRVVLETNLPHPAIPRLDEFSETVGGVVRGISSVISFILKTVSIAQ